MQEQIDSTNSQPNQQTPNPTSDDVASRGIQPTIEQVDYHTPPTEVVQEVSITQNVSQAGPIAPDSKPTQIEEQATRPTGKRDLMLAAGAALCVCIVIVLSVNHRL